MATGGVAVVGGATGAVAAAGFGAAGISAGSLGAWMMSISGPVAKGTPTIQCQTMQVHVSANGYCTHPLKVVDHGNVHLSQKAKYTTDS